MSDLIAELMALVDGKSDLRIDDAVATGNNTVTVGSSTVAVVLPAIISVGAGQFCQVLTQGPNRVILGPVGGSGGTYTPTLTNVAIGTGGTPLNTATWRYAEGILTVQGEVQLGTAGMSVTGVPTISLPSGFNWVSTPARMPIGRVRFENNGVAAYLGSVFGNTASTAQILSDDSSGTTLTPGTVSATVPFTWGADDFFGYAFTAAAVRV